jgi:hypothetical protein
MLATQVAQPRQQDGFYVRKQGLRRIYDYTLNWGDGWWKADVHYHGELKGSLGNSVPAGAPMPETALRAIESSIESLLQMVE